MAKTTTVDKGVVPEPANPPRWTTEVTPSATASSSTTKPPAAAAGVRVPDALGDSDLETLTKLLQESVEVKEETVGPDHQPEGDGAGDAQTAGYYNGVWCEPDDLQPGLWWKYYPGCGWTRWRDFKVTWPLNQLLFSYIVHLKSHCPVKFYSHFEFIFVTYANCCNEATAGR